MSVWVFRASRVLLDVAMLAAAFALAFFLRYDFAPDASVVGRIILLLPYVVAGEYIVLRAFGIPRFSWRFIGVREATRILVAMLVITVALSVVRLVLGPLQYEYGYLRHGIIPFGVIAANFGLGFLSLVGMRVVRRRVGESRDAGRVVRTSEGIRTMLVGAGQAGLLVARELSRRPELGVVPVGFVDDDPSKVGIEIHGVRVLGKTHSLAELCAKHNASEVLISMANVHGTVIRRIREACRDADIPAKIVPGLYEIVGGKVNLTRIREIAIEDLLRREPIVLEQDSLEGFLRGQTVLVTGAGGSIGSELCRQILHFEPARVILVERGENNLFLIERELRNSKIECIPCIADVTDRVRMEQVIRDYQPAVILHAAAHKHVPMMEHNPLEAVKNNILGTKTVADLAQRFGVGAFVMISTDKAVNPTSVMGASKRFAELYVQGLSGAQRKLEPEASKTRFVTVRFGNVLGSAGSVIPIFRKQIQRGGPVTVTHPEMTRYFMTIPEACQLVLQAGSMGAGGEIFILDMGEPVKIVDLAKDLISLSGLRVGEDIEITFTGTRPGEKLFEELSVDSECAGKTRHPKIFIGTERGVPLATVDNALQRLGRLATAAEVDAESVVNALCELIPEYKPNRERKARASEEGEKPVATSAQDLPMRQTGA